MTLPSFVILSGASARTVPAIREGNGADVQSKDRYSWNGLPDDRGPSTPARKSSAPALRMTAKHKVIGLKDRVSSL